MGEEKMVYMGLCLRAHGLNGGLTLQLFNKEDSHLAPGVEVTLEPLRGSPLKAPLQLPISEIAFGNKVICHFEGIHSLEQVEDLIPFSLHVARSGLPQPEEGSFYLADLLGVTVRDAHGVDQGRVLGTYENGAQTVLEVQWGSEKVDIPLAPPFVVNYDSMEQGIEQGWIQLLRPRFVP